MASLALSSVLLPLLADARELEEAHTRLRTGRRGRQWRLGALNRAVVVMGVSAWEAYVEEVLKEAVVALRPANQPLGSWSALNAVALSQAGRFNNPNVQNVRALFADLIGLPDVTTAWFWRNCTTARAREYLEEAMRQRHHIAHGVNPRPTIHNAYSSWLPDFFEKLGTCTDGAVRLHLVTVLGIPNPWP